MKYTEVDGDGTITHHDDGAPPELIEAEVRRRVEEQIDARLGKSSSEGASWLLELRAQNQAFIQPIEFGGDLGDWFIKKLCLEDVDEMGIYMGVDGYGLRDMKSIEARASFSRALLLIGVCCGKENPARKWADIAETGAFYSEPRGNAALVARALRDQLLLFNPFFAVENDDGKKKVLAPSDFA